MNILVVAVWEVNVDDIVHSRNMDAAMKEVSANQYSTRLLELTHNSATLGPILLALDKLNVVDARKVAPLTQVSQVSPDVHEGHNLAILLPRVGVPNLLNQFRQFGLVDEFLILMKVENVLPLTYDFSAVRTHVYV